MTSTAKRAAMAEALERLKAFVAEMGDMSLEFTPPLTADMVTKLEEQYGLKLPPSYVHFITTHGTFKVVYGQELIGMTNPAHLRSVSPDAEDATDGDDPDVAAAIDEALFFQREYDDAVDNFYCFNPRDVTADGEMDVVGYFHDERFELTTPYAGTDRFKDFAAHIVQVIDQFIEDFAEG